MKTILIVEDDPNAGLLYEEALSDEGFHIIQAHCGNEALRLVAEQHPDLVVLDISLPDMNGLEVLGFILSEHPHLPVILNSAYGGYKEEFMCWAANACVIKSSDLSELIMQIHEVLATAAC